LFIHLPKVRHQLGVLGELPFTYPLDDHGIDPFVSPLESRAGFVFSNLKLGTKQVRVKLYGPRRVHVFELYVPIPGFRADCSPRGKCRKQGEEVGP